MCILVSALVAITVQSELFSKKKSLCPVCLFADIRKSSIIELLQFNFAAPQSDFCLDQRPEQPLERLEIRTLVNNLFFSDFVSLSSSPSDEI